VRSDVSLRELEVAHEILLPLLVRRGEATLRLFSTVTTFGTPLDVTLAELAIEAFYPADAATADVLARLLSASAAG
jgi:hypothetical protein